MLKVLFNTYPTAFNCPGGGEVQLLQSKAALERRGVQVVLYDQWAPQFEQVDIVHYFSTQGWTMPFFDTAQKHNLPIVASPIIWLGENKYDYDLNGIGTVVRSCNLVLPNSKAEASLLADYYNLPLEKFVPIVNGVSETFFTSGDKKLFREKYSIKKPFLLNIANIEPRKNQLNLIKASRDCGMDLILFGRIRDTTYWQECQKHLHKGVRYLGTLEYASQLHKAAYAACHAFILPSLLETPGLAALEAAAQGAPVCITSEGCAYEYFGKQATYINPESVDSIRQGIFKVQGITHSSAISQLIKDKYTWDTTAEQLVDVYKKFIKTL